MTLTDPLVSTLDASGNIDNPEASELKAWALSGLLHLTGHRDGPPLWPSIFLFSGLNKIASATQQLASEMIRRHVIEGRRPTFDAAEEVCSRAALMGLDRNGATSPSGTCKLLATRSGYLALNLSRHDDIEALPALAGLLGISRLPDPELGGSSDPIPPSDPITSSDPIPENPQWAYARDIAASVGSEEMAAAAQTLGIPTSVLANRAGDATTDRSAPSAPPAVTTRRLGHSISRRGASPLVVDLSSMWAGPLCGQLLAGATAQVLKVESTSRPDGARKGNPVHFDRLNHLKQSVQLDFRSAEGLSSLHALLDRSDIVIDSSRPRALAGLGMDPARYLMERPGRTWVSITGYGRGDQAPGGPGRVAFGDDAAVAGGLVAYDARGRPMFCGDALADPLTGIVAAHATMRSWLDGGGHLVEVSLAGVAQTFAALSRAAHPRTRQSTPETRSASSRPVISRWRKSDYGQPDGEAESGMRSDEWWVRSADGWTEILPPSLPPACPRAPSLGEHTAEVARWLRDAASYGCDQLGANAGLH